MWPTWDPWAATVLTICVVVAFPLSRIVESMTADLHPDRTDQATAPSVKPPTQETPDMDSVTTPRIPATMLAEPAGHQKWEIADAVRNSSHERALLARGWEPFSAVNAAAQTIVLYRRRTPITITYPAGPTDA